MPRNAPESGTVHGILTRGCPSSMPAQAASTTPSGVNNGVNSGALTPWNIPVSMKAGQTVVTCGASSPQKIDPTCSDPRANYQLSILMQKHLAPRARRLS
jgi:hypothetical protein